MTEIKVSTHEYPKDNGLNFFGDYTHLVAMQTRSKGRVSEPVWTLVNKQTGLVQKLTPKEVRECLHVLFFSGAVTEYK